jgi:HemY protein
MLKALWFLARLALLAAAILWFARHPGTVEINWQGYVIETSVGFLAAVIGVLLLVYTVAYRAWRAAAGTPALWRRYQKAKRRELGYRHVTAGLVAVAAGDARGAEKYARQGEKLIPDAPLSRLLLAQSHLLKGNMPKARLAFAELLDDTEAAFFGVKALLQEALRAGDHREALQHIRRADELQPGRAWIAKALFDLEARNHEWAKAASALKACARLGVFRPEEATAHRQALLLAEADDAFARDNPVQAHKLAARAFAIDPGFTPAALRLARFYRSVGKTKSALKAIERSFAAAPHPDLAKLWMEALPSRRKSASPYQESKAVQDWARRLYGLNPDHREALRMMGAAALAARNFAEARALLMRAGDYRALARLEREESGNEAKARAWLEQAADAPPDHAWACASCGHAAQDWSALCARCGNFNTVRWMMPQASAAALAYRSGAGDGVLDIPA